MTVRREKGGGRRLFRDVFDSEQSDYVRAQA